MNTDQYNLADFFTKGFITGKFHKDLLYLKEFHFVDSTNHSKYSEDVIVNSKECEEILDHLHIEIGQKYISKIFSKYELVARGLFEGVDDKSMKWHNDQEYGNMNTNFLIYLDETESYRNSIEVKDQVNHYELFPKANEFVWLNQAKNFQHRASHNYGRRRILWFDYLGSI